MTYKTIVPEVLEGEVPDGARTPQAEANAGQDVRDSRDSRHAFSDGRLRGPYAPRPCWYPLGRWVSSISAS